ncbi:ALG6, ALG8 glycosyltransferase family-domain-containing protein, partial [Catenaria anguillulae PL171]
MNATTAQRNTQSVPKRRTKAMSNAASAAALAMTRGTLNRAQPQPQPTASSPAPKARKHHGGKSGHKAASAKPRTSQPQQPSLLSQILTPLASASGSSPVSPSLALISLALVIRAAVARHSWSGRNAPPMYGDFEAQRHWLEIMWHLPVSQWYRYDLHAHFIDPSWVALDTSRGIETPLLVAYMRFTVLLTDLLIYLPACLHFVNRALKRQSATAKLHALSVLLFFPGLVLIDHGHFQYNLVMLGLSMYAFTSMAMGNHLRSAVAFSMALLFKQMALYFALPVFVFLLSKCFERKHGLRLFISLGATVVATFAIHLYPFRNDLPHVAHRIFPVARGLYEDKVANLWCSLSPVLKLRSLFTLDQLVRLSLVTTLLAHEKSILLPLLPAVMLAGAEWERTRGWVVGFVALANYSMWPLLRRDGVGVPYFVLTAAWLALLGVDLLCICLLVHVAEALFDPPARYPDLFVVANQIGKLEIWQC